MSIVKRLRFSAAIMAVCAPIGAVHAERLAGLTTDQRLITFDSAAPGTAFSSFALTGLTAGDRILGIDLRPANNRIYGVSQTGRVYSISTGGVASFVSQLTSSGMPVSLDGPRFGVDFNPVPDRLRIISDGGQNLRANIDTGGVTTDTSITRAGGGAISILGTGYTNSLPGPAPATTTIYGIDDTTDSLVTATPANGGANGGVYSSVGALNVALGAADAVAFDISGFSGTGFLSINSLLYSVDLTSGAATSLGSFGRSSLIGLTAIGAIPEPASWAMMIAGFGIVGASLRRRRPTLAFA